MKKPHVLFFIAIVILLMIAGSFLIRNIRIQKVKTFIENIGWIPMREPFSSQSFDYYNKVENWKETEQLIGQTSALKFFSTNQFVCEWEPVNKIKDLVWILANCAELVGEGVEKRAMYIVLKLGKTGNIEAFFIPVGNDHSYTIVFSGNDPEKTNMLSETRLDHLNMRLSSNEDIPPLAAGRKSLLH